MAKGGKKKESSKEEEKRKKKAEESSSDSDDQEDGDKNKQSDPKDKGSGKASEKIKKKREGDDKETESQEDEKIEGEKNKKKKEAKNDKKAKGVETVQDGSEKLSDEQKKEKKTSKEPEKPPGSSRGGGGEEKDKDEGKKRKGKDPEEKDSPLEVSSVGEKSFATMLDMLSAISAVHRAHTEVEITYDSLGCVGYGPSEWAFEMSDDVVQRYEIILIGQEKVPYVFKKPLFESKFKSIDEFLSSQLDHLGKLVSICFKLRKEPSNVALNGVLMAEPEALGVPLSALLESNLNPEDIHSAITPFCRTIRDRNVNFSHMYLFEGINVGDIREDLFAIHREVIPNLRDQIEAMLEHTLDGHLRAKSLVPINNSTLLAGVANPANLNAMFVHIPRRVHLSATLVSETLVPEITLTPLAASQLLSLGAQTATKISCINTLANVSYSPSMATEISMYVLSLLFPGYVQFQLTMDDIDADDTYTRCLVGLICKILLSYSDQDRWNSVTPRTLHLSELAIARAGMDAGILESNHLGADYQLGRVVPVRNSGLHEFEGLQTTDAGVGWRDDGMARYAPPPPGVAYPACQRRQLFATALDQVESIESGEASIAFNDWNVRIAVLDFLRALSKGRMQRTPMTGIDCIFQVLSRRVMHFMIAVNDYNRLHWYTGLRLAETDMQNMFPDNSETPILMNIKAKTLLYMFKGLSEKSVGPRRKGFDVQVKAECGLMRDCIETASRFRLRELLLQKYRISDDYFTSSQRMDAIIPKSGPLAVFFEVLRHGGMLRDLGPFYECSNGSPYHDVYARIVDIITENPLEFGVMPKTIMRASVPVRRVERLREMVARNCPYTNAYSERVDRLVPVDEGVPNERIDLPRLGQLIGSYSAFETLREFSLRGPLELHIPLPLKCSVVAFPTGSEEPFTINYTAIDKNRNLRDVLTLHEAPLTIVSVDVNKLLKPDLYLKGLSPCETNFIAEDDLSLVLIPASSWLERLGDEAHSTIAVRTDLVRIVPFLERV